MDDCGDYSDEANCGKKLEDPPPSASPPVTGMGGMLKCLLLPQQHRQPALKSLQEEQSEEGKWHPVGARPFHFLCTVAGGHSPCTEDSG